MIDSPCSSKSLRCSAIALACLLGVSQAAMAQPDRVSGLGFDITHDRVTLKQSGQPIADFVYQDPDIRRPYFANVRLKSRRQVTRNHPPVAGKDATDHSDMHPGVWLAFGDINGQDFWRNKARIDHLGFSEGPTITGGRLRFATASQLIGSKGELIGRMENRLAAEERPSGWRLTWEAEFSPGQEALVFGDQEEMGFGTRVFTDITEKNGGLITSSAGAKTAKATWGQPADWCDYSGTLDGAPCGVTVMTGPSNFRPSWWHNRDYGLLVANAFGRAAMKQGEKSEVKVTPGRSLKLVHAATFHEGPDYDPAGEYTAFVKSLADHPPASVNVGRNHARRPPRPVTIFASTEST